METALDRLSKIKSFETYNSYVFYGNIRRTISDIQEVVALAKSNQQPTIDAMRFEAAKAAMESILKGLVTPDSFSTNDIAVNSVYFADALILELQKEKK